MTRVTLQLIGMVAGAAVVVAVLWLAAAVLLSLHGYVETVIP